MQLSARNLGGLPPELLVEILSHVRVLDIVNMRRLNKDYHRFVQDYQDQLGDRIMAQERHRLATDLGALDFDGVDILTAVQRYLGVRKTHLYGRFDTVDAIDEALTLGRLYADCNANPWHKLSYADQDKVTARLQYPAVGPAAKVFVEQLLIRMNLAWRTVCPAPRVKADDMQGTLEACAVDLGGGRVAEMFEAAQELGRCGVACDDIHPVAGADNSIRIAELDAMLHRHSRHYSTLPHIKAYFWNWKNEAFESLNLPKISEKGVWPTFTWPTDYSRREKKLRSWELLCDWYKFGCTPCKLQMAAVLEDASLGLKMDGKDFMHEE
ncbi:hypothetical protein Tdes44962_MAKER01048 [Teratosphaeria destructans]|uniref:F-box domain-containing protein n=1 Tax=Teratosphaeria destructans TaxID=418781 RepID=A0A9W7SI99_9PEZI|nr:hypothetical protein Tdes44962_MAKER01048 [Teratosphaeria destructans]